MKQTMTWTVLASLALCAAACGGDDDLDNTSSSSSSSGEPGASSSSSGEPSASSSSGSSSGASSSGEVPCEDTAFTYPSDDRAALEPSVYQALFSLHEDFPFAVVGLYSTALEGVVGPSMVGEDGRLLAYGNGDPLVVHQLTPPNAATGPLSDEPLEFALPPNAFGEGAVRYTASYASPVFPLPSDAWLLPFTSEFQDGIVPGYAHLYSAPGTLAGGAWVNGIYSLVGRSHGGVTNLAYHATAALSATRNSDNVSGLYTSNMCDDQLVGDGCAPALLRVPTPDESSGPVVSDANGNLYFGTFGASGVHVRGLDRCASLAQTSSAAPAPLLTLDDIGSSSLAVLPPAEGVPGYVVHANYSNEVVAQAFVSGADGFVSDGDSLPFAIVPGDAAEALWLFADHDGYLWLTVETADGVQVAQLRRQLP